MVFFPNAAVRALLDGFCPEDFDVFNHKAMVEMPVKNGDCELVATMHKLCKSFLKDDPSLAIRSTADATIDVSLLEECSKEKMSEVLSLHATTKTMAGATSPFLVVNINVLTKV